MPIARLVISELNRFLGGRLGRPPAPPGRVAPLAARRGPRLALLALAAFLLGALPIPQRLLPWLPAIPRAYAGLATRTLGPDAQQVDPMLQPLPPDFPRGWRLTVPPPLPDPGSSQVQVRVDETTGFVEERYREGNVEVRTPIMADMLDYNELLSDRTYRRVWLERTRTTRSVNKEGLRKGGIFQFTVPVQLPKSVRSIVGNGAPTIEVSGSERISILGVSDWVVNNTELTGERKRQGAFPSFEMKQELNVNMTGSIGDKIKVDIDQSSNVQTNLDNKVKLRYEGDDDDMIKTIELGNTNLSLQGASLRQDGLFGVKTVAKMGNFDFTVIASKQDAKTETARFTPSGEKRNVRVTDLEYIRRTYYFIADRPVDASNLQLRVFRADAGYLDVASRPRGIARVDPTAPWDSLSNPEIPTRWAELTIGTDYAVDYPYVLQGTSANLKIPVLRLFNQLGESQMLAVSYVDGGNPVGLTDVAGNSGLGKPDSVFLLKMLKPTPNYLNEDANGLIDRTNPWFRTVGYELRNYYDLGGREIDPTSLSLKVRKIENGQATDPDDAPVDGERKPLLAILGLDQTGKPGSDDPFKPDGIVDDRFVNYETGILFFPDLHPFAPDTSALYSCGPAAGGLNCLDDLVRNRLWTADSLKNLNVYYDKNPETGKDERYYIDADFKSSQQGFYLGRFGILEGSEQVKVDGIPQRRDSDYRIDYDTGLINFTRAPGPEQVITVDFSYAPGFGQVQRSLLGFSGGYNPASNLSFSTSLLHESRGAQEQNVKLGEEPAQSTLGDFGTVLAFRPVWMTRLADRVPGVTTDQPSALNIQGNFSVSLPNPNTKGEAYIDDMEGNRETNTISLARLSWFWSSIPVSRVAPGDSVTTSVSSLVTDHAMLEWYNPRPDGPTGQREWYLKPVLTQAEGGDNNHQVLEMNVKPPTGTTSMDPNDWTGITQSLGNVGQDFSRVRFVEIWLNDFTARHDSTKMFLHVSLGSLSEDAFWNPNAPPNGLLDTEDRNFDGKLDGGCDRSDPNYEDTGLDGIQSKNEPGYDASTNPDPDQDDYTYSVNGPNADDYSTINRLEGNGLCEPNARPDTEDLNRNTLFDTNNDYFETSIDLASSEFVAIDVPVLYAGNSHVKADNGWRLFRIPVTAETFRQIGHPSWQNVQAMRVWLSGIERPMKVQLGGVEFVGSRWLEAAITNPDMIARDVQLDIRTRNNKDDAGIYVPPYEVQSQIGNNADRREQSLALGYTRMGEGDSVLAFKTLGLPGTGLGWAQYRQIKFYVHGEVGKVETQNLRIVARFGPDTLNYYEYSAPIRGDWQKVLIPLDALSGLKEQRARGVNLVIDSTSAAASGEFYTVKGNPSFTNITRLTFGLTVHGASVSAPPATGEVWIDELRLADVVKESGTSSNVSIQASFADLLALNVSVQKQDQDFFRVGQGGNQGTGLNHSAIGLNTTLNLDRFMPTSNVSLPVRLSVQHATDVPKFRTGSDVTLTGNQSDIETRRLDQQTVDISYRRSSPVRRGLAKYTLDAINGTMSYSRRAEIQPQSVDSSWAFRVGGGYDLPLGGGGVRLSKKVKVNLLPDVVGFSMSWDSRRSLLYSRQIFVDADSTALRSDAKARVLVLGTNASYTPFGSFRVTYNLQSTRDMLIHQEGPLGWNKGTEVAKTQTAQVNYTPRWLALFNPNVSLKGTYTEDARPELRLSTSDPKGLKNIQNSGIANVDMNLPISRLGSGSGTKRGGGPRDTTGGFSPLQPFRLFFSKLQDIRTTFTFDRRATASRVVGDAGLAFRTGFTEVTAADLDRTLSGSIQTTSRRYTTRLSSALRPSSSFTVDIRADHSLTFSEQGLGDRRTERFQWPDLQGRWVDLHKALRLDRTLTSLTVRSGFSRITDEDGPSDGPLERRTTTDTYGPILGWDFVFKNGVRTSLTSSLTHAVAVDQRAIGVTRDRQTSSTDLRVTKTFPAAKGIKFPFAKKRVRLPNDLNLNLTCGLTGDRQAVRSVGRDEYIENNVKGLKVSSGTAYNFSRAISGGFNFEFRQNNDIKNRVKRRGITVDLNAQFSF